MHGRRRVAPLFARLLAVRRETPTDDMEVGMVRNYKPPAVKFLGTISDLTQSKPGIYFDFPGSAEGNKTPPSPGSPGTVS